MNKYRETVESSWWHFLRLLLEITICAVEDYAGTASVAISQFRIVMEIVTGKLYFSIHSLLLFINREPFF